ncbi:unnamed protein product [Caenorhabditis brenneri]
MTTSDYSTTGVRVALNNADLWQKFYPGNEMVVTKAGRKLFPDLEVSIEGLDRDAFYTVHLYLERVNNMRYHFNRDKNSGTGEWEEVGPVKDTPVIVKKAHNRGGLVGSKWMEAPVSFSQIYITNDPETTQKQTKNDPILVTSMLKYQPIITVKRVYDGYEEEFKMTMTEFMVVTAYQDLKIIELKKANNKYANGFKPEGKHMTRPQNETPRRGKRANPSGPPPPSTGGPSFGTPAIKIVPPLSWGQNYLQVSTTPSGPSNNFQMMTTPSTLITPPSMVATPPTPLSGGPPPSFQGNQFMTPPTMPTTPSTLITPPSMGGTPLTPSSGGSQNFQNSIYDYTWNYQYGTWDMSQKAGGAPGPQWNQNQGVNHFQNFQQFENPGNVPQNNLDFAEHDGAGTSSQSGSTDFDFRF